MTSTVSPRVVPAPAVNSVKAHFRADVQGLRAVAVLVVLLYHGGLPWLPGGYVGVDVFFVISGFLITGLLIRELATSGTISLVDFYARRARRILPAALLVILLTLVAVVLWLPRSRWGSIGWDGLGAAFSVVNWQYAASTTDYLQQDQAPSPLQHYWSLAVEEQFYLLWPLLLFVVVTGMARLGIARRRRRTTIPPNLETGSGTGPGTGVGADLGTGSGAGVGVASRSGGGAATVGAVRGALTHREVCCRVLGVSVVVFGLSLAHSIQFSAENQGAAYFITTTRIWELAVGAALAAALPLLPPLAGALRAVLGWAGLAAVVTAAAVFDAQTVFPGYAALLPVLGAGAVILAGSPSQDASWSAAVALSLRPMRFVGDISYSLYLMHWPVLTIVAGALFADELPARVGVPLAVATILPAWLCYRFLERPFMRWRFVAPRRAALRTGAAGMLAVGLAAMALVAVPRVSSMVDAPATTDRLQGAAALAQDPQAGVPVDTVSSVYPTPANARQDKAAVYDQECIVKYVEAEPKYCAFGPEAADTNIVLIGDSHAAHWLPALQQAAETHGWRVHTFIKSSCGVVATPVIRTVEGVDSEYTECLEWNEQVVDEVVALNPDLMVVSASRYKAAGDVAVAEGMAEAWGEYTDAGVEVAVLNDVPRPVFNVPECVEENRDSLTECAYDREEAIAASGAPQLERAAALHGDVELIDLNDQVCPHEQEQCPVVIGGALAFYDGHHLTATYSSTLARPVGEALKPLLR